MLGISKTWPNEWIMSALYGARDSLGWEDYLFGKYMYFLYGHKTLWDVTVKVNALSESSHYIEVVVEVYPQRFFKGKGILLFPSVRPLCYLLNHWTKSHCFCWFSLHVNHWMDFNQTCLYTLLGEKKMTFYLVFFNEMFLSCRVPKNSKWVWSGNTTITNCRQPRDTARKSRSTITRHQEDKLSKAISSLFPIKMIAILEWT